MRVVIQRVSEASVSVNGTITGAIQHGLLILVAVREGDDHRALDFLAEKIIHVRIFPDDEGKMNRSVIDIGGGILVVSQFTLYGDCRKGRRPSFIGAANPAFAEEVYNQFVQRLKATGIPVQTGVFAADMKVSLTNDGPVTLIIDSP
jgi:D-tyrosyl-tRNA(Tyr) deacylase